MGTVHISIHTGRRANRRPGARQIGVSVALMQRAHAVYLHAERDECLPCGITATAMNARAALDVPGRFLRDEAWVHRHVVMPSLRIHARMLDEGARGDDDE